MTTNSTDSKRDFDGWARELGVRTIMLHHALGESMGLSAVEHKAAHILLRFGPMTAGELAEETGLTTGAVTGLVDRLEKADLVRREHDPKDRRRVIIAPTEGEYANLYELPVLRKAVLELMNDYDEHQREAIVDFALKATQAVKDETERIRALAAAQKRS